MFDEFLIEIKEAARQNGMSEKEIQSLMNKYKGDISLRFESDRSGVLPFNKNYKI